MFTKLKNYISTEQVSDHDTEINAEKFFFAN